MQAQQRSCTKKNHKHDSTTFETLECRFHPGLESRVSGCRLGVAKGQE